jgi:TRAP-type C4-dicarboxylate transport system permease small subunit
VKSLEKIIRKADGVLMSISMGILSVLMFLGAADVIGRYFLNKPIKGAYELSQPMLAAVILFSWAYVQSKKGHVSVDLLVVRLRPRIQAAIDFCTTTIILILCSLMVWQGIVKCMYAHKIGEVLDVVDIPLYPFLLVVPIGAFFISLELILQLVISFTKMAKRV